MDAETAAYWLTWVHRGSTIAMALVAIGVGYEFLADRIAAPLNEIVDAGRKAELARLRDETAKANARAQEASKDDAQSKLELQRILDRRPFKEQREAIVSRLKEIPAVDIGIIRLTVFPPEARGLWNAFESMFSDAWGRDHVRRALLSKAGPLEGTHGILIAAVPGSQGSVGMSRSLLILRGDGSSVASCLRGFLPHVERL